MSTADGNSLEAALIAADPVIGPELQRVASDPNFAAAWTRLADGEFAQQFTIFNSNLTQYNDFHRRERRMWSVKLGKGAVAPDLEAGLKAAAPAAIQQYTTAFKSLDACLGIIIESELRPLVNGPVGDITRRYLLDETTIFGQTGVGYFRSLGIDTPMLDEFKAHFQSANLDYVGVVAGGDVANMRPMLAAAVQAQVEVLTYTQQHGLDYIRGHGPPAWAVTVSEILGYVGISISAWAVVAVIAGLLVTVVLVCAAHILPQSLQNLCGSIPGITVGQY
jgi:hypothetical protein